MEIIKKTLKVEEASGWYLLENQYRTWTENITDEDTGEIASAERREIALGKGCRITLIDISILNENGIENVCVSNFPLKGNKRECMSLWETSLKIKSGTAEKKRIYFVSAESPTVAEKFISDYLEVNVECTFESVKVCRLDYNQVIKLYDTEREEYERFGDRRIRWYKSQIFALIDGDGETSANPVKNILVQATDFETALKAIKSVAGRNEYDEIYNAFKSMQELNVAEVFIPDENVSYYSNDEL